MPIVAVFDFPGEILGPATHQAGLDAKPAVHHLVGTIDQNGARATY